MYQRKITFVKTQWHVELWEILYCWPYWRSKLPACSLLEKPLILESWHSWRQPNVFHMLGHQQSWCRFHWWRSVIWIGLTMHIVATKQERKGGRKPVHFFLAANHTVTATAIYPTRPSDLPTDTRRNNNIIMSKRHRDDVLHDVIITSCARWDAFINNAIIGFR